MRRPAGRSAPRRGASAARPCGHARARPNGSARVVRMCPDCADPPARRLGRRAQAAIAAVRIRTLPSSRGRRPCGRRRCRPSRPRRPRRRLRAGAAPRTSPRAARCRPRWRRRPRRRPRGTRGRGEVAGEELVGRRAAGRGEHLAVEARARARSRTGTERSRPARPPGPAAYSASCW